MNRRDFIKNSSLALGGLFILPKALMGAAEALIFEEKQKYTSLWMLREINVTLEDYIHSEIQQATLDFVSKFNSCIKLGITILNVEVEVDGEGLIIFKTSPKVILKLQKEYEYFIDISTLMTGKFSSDSVTLKYADKPYISDFNIWGSLNY